MNQDVVHRKTAFVFDLDGALVGSVYQHVLAWREALESEGVELSVWMGGAVFAYHIATTMFAVPHEALGAELSTSYHDRTRIFGVKHIVGATGGLLALGGMEALRRAEDPRAAASASTDLHSFASRGRFLRGWQRHLEDAVLE